MPRRRRKSKVIDQPRQQAALASPVRLEVLEQFCGVGPMTVRDIADRTGRTPHAINYHVRRLVEAGLVERTGSRKSGPRDQAIYDVVADRFEVPVDARRRGEESVVVRVARAVLRRAERDFAALARDDPARLDGDDAFAARLRARVSAGARDEILRHANAIQRIFARELRREPSPRARLETFTLTMVLTPEPRAK